MELGSGSNQHELHGRGIHDLFLAGELPTPAGGEKLRLPIVVVRLRDDEEPDVGEDTLTQDRLESEAEPADLSATLPGHV